MEQPGRSDVAIRGECADRRLGSGLQVGRRCEQGLGRRWMSQGRPRPPRPHRIRSCPLLSVRDAGRRRCSRRYGRVTRQLRGPHSVDRAHTSASVLVIWIASHAGYRRPALLGCLADTASRSARTSQATRRPRRPSSCRRGRCCSVAPGRRRRRRGRGARGHGDECRGRAGGESVGRSVMCTASGAWASWSGRPSRSSTGRHRHPAISSTRGARPRHGRRGRRTASGSTYPTTTNTPAPPHFALPTRPVLLIGLVGLCAVFGEQAGTDWSAFYIRNDLAGRRASQRWLSRRSLSRWRRSGSWLLRDPQSGGGPYRPHLRERAPSSAPSRSYWRLAWRSVSWASRCSGSDWQSSSRRCFAAGA